VIVTGILPNSAVGVIWPQASDQGLGPVLKPARDRATNTF
jgi:hypothetical protein